MEANWISTFCTQLGSIIYKALYTRGSFQNPQSTLSPDPQYRYIAISLVLACFIIPFSWINSICWAALRCVAREKSRHKWQPATTAAATAKGGGGGGVTRIVVQPDTKQTHTFTRTHTAGVGQPQKASTEFAFIPCLCLYLCLPCPCACVCLCVCVVCVCCTACYVCEWEQTCCLLCLHLAWIITHNKWWNGYQEDYPAFMHRYRFVVSCW